MEAKLIDGSQSPQLFVSTFSIVIRKTLYRSLMVIKDQLRKTLAPFRIRTNDIKDNSPRLKANFLITKF